MIDAEKLNALARALGEAINPLTGEGIGQIAGFHIVTAVAVGDGAFQPLVLRGLAIPEVAALLDHPAFGRCEDPPGAGDCFEIEESGKH